ncbi:MULTISPECIES: hypothetical protein [unclassified Tamlana]|uniref:hypothetical protein n=1 Tax=unclassified Tamlana TaxID=2614803 RepID=UPI0026E2C117|nr:MULTISPECIES: hypothetical protein [unclassified Tamlana]MDO6790930.1 hypothetical protein [Tamlana sp. 1_MG-2023]
MKYPIGSVGHLYSRLKEVKSTDNIDVLFLGSSHAIRGFNTRDIEKGGYKCFNLGCKAGTPLQTLTLLKRYLYQLNPKTVVFEVFPATFEIDGIESSLHLLANDAVDQYAIEMALKYSNPKVYNTLTYGMISDFFKINSSFIEDSIKGNDTYFRGGYVERKGCYWTPRAFGKHKIKLNQNQIVAFEEIIKMLKSKNIKVILVFAPVSPSYYSRYSNVGQFDSIMESYTEYYNFNKIINLNDSIHFYDEHHMNKEGVDLFSPKIIEMLNKEKARTHNILHK